MAKKFVLNYPPKCRKCSKKNECGYKEATAGSILLDCGSFYYVFCQLEEQAQIPFDNPEELKRHVEEMDEGKHPFITPPMVTLGAFSAELALKFLTFKETGTFSCVHNIEGLYDELPPIHKEALSTQIKTQAHQNDVTLVQCIHQMANLFDDWRYFFEKQSIAYTAFFNVFVHIVCDYALGFKQKQPIE